MAKLLQIYSRGRASKPSVSAVMLLETNDGRKAIAWTENMPIGGSPAEIERVLQSNYFPSQDLTEVRHEHLIVDRLSELTKPLSWRSMAANIRQLVKDSDTLKFKLFSAKRDLTFL